MASAWIIEWNRHRKDSPITDLKPHILPYRWKSRRVMDYTPGLGVDLLHSSSPLDARRFHLLDGLVFQHPLRRPRPGPNRLRPVQRRTDEILSRREPSVIICCDLCR